MAITAKARSLTALTATVALNPAEALEIVKQAAEQVKEPGFGRADGKFIKTEVRVRIQEEHPDWLALMIGSERTTKPATTFSAVAEAADGGTSLRVGGLEKYRIFQTKFLGLIPSGPASITHFHLYRRFLKEVASRLEAGDPAAVVSVGVPEA
jgi:hypothetical protein